MDDFNFNQFDDIVQSNFYADDFAHFKINQTDKEDYVNISLDFDELDDDSENFDFI